MLCAAAAIACRPDAQALLIVCAGAVTGTPARCPTCRAGFGPEPACRPWPTDHLVDRIGGNAGALQCGAGGHGAKFGRMGVLQRAAVAADRRACGAENDDLARIHSLSDDIKRLFKSTGADRPTSRQRGTALVPMSEHCVGGSSGENSRSPPSMALIPRARSEYEDQTAHNMRSRQGRLVCRWM